MVSSNGNGNMWRIVAMWGLGSIFTIVVILAIPSIIKAQITNYKENQVAHAGIVKDSITRDEKATEGRKVIAKDISKIQVDIGKILTRQISTDSALKRIEDKL